jgi:H+/Na+-translocating ferredoxin:NAD+ oxidoreductase subunit B
MMTLTFIITLSIITLFSIAIGFLSSQQELPTEQQTRKHNINAIDRLLPQTQCGDCGFQACRPYAEALARHETDINRCLPGGDETIKALATMLGAEIKPSYKDNKKYDHNSHAVIDETLCIGCVKCIAPCPVDAILGAPKQMHSVINQYCTGCELCIAPCPVDCISMVAAR